LLYTSLTGERLAVSGIQFVWGRDKQNNLINSPDAGQSWNCNIAAKQNHYGHITLPRYNRETEGGKIFLTSSILLWNFLPAKRRSSESINSFKRKYIEYVKEGKANVDRFTIS